MSRFSIRHCRTCQGPFRPKCGRQLDCAKCRAARGQLKPSKRRSQRIVQIDARPCRDCGDEFVPVHGAQKHCNPCRAKRKAMGSALYKIKADDDVRPAKPGARAGDFEPPTTACSRCAHVVRLTRTEEYETVTRDGGKPGNPADRLILCRACYRERSLKTVVPETSDGIFDARAAATARCLMILLSLDRGDRRAAWATLGRAVEAMR